MVLVLQILTLSALQLPVVQRALSSRIADFLGDYLQTEVTIERVDFGWMNRITLDGVRIEDQRREELLRARRISVKMNLPALIGGKVKISTAQLFGARANLYKVHPDSVPNYQFFLDAFASKDSMSEKKTDIQIRSLFLRNLNISYNLRYKERTPGHFNPAHLHLSNMNANIRLKALTNDSVNLSVKRLRFREETSGMELGELSFALRSNHREARLEHFFVKMPHSIVTLDDTDIKFNLNNNSNGVLSMLSSIETHTALHAHPFNPQDLSSFLSLPATAYRDIDLDAEVTTSKGYVRLNRLFVRCADDILLEASGELLHKNFNKESLSANGQLKELTVTPEGFSLLASCIPSADSLIHTVQSRVEEVQMSGSGSWSNHTSDALLTVVSPRFSAKINAFYAQDGSFSGSLFGQDIDVAALTGSEEPLRVEEAEISVEGKAASRETLQATANVRLHNIAYQDYIYKELNTHASYTREKTTAHVDLSDPYANVAVDAALQTNNKLHRLQLVTEVQNFNPDMLNLSNKYPNTSFDLHLSADVQGTNLEDALWEIHLGDFKMHREDDSRELNHLDISLAHTEGGKELLLESDFMRAHVLGEYRYATLPRSVRRIVERQLPNLFPTQTAIQSTDNQLTFNIEVQPNTWLNDLLRVPLAIQEPLTLQGELDDRLNAFSLAVDTRQIEYNKETLRDIELRCNTRSNHIACNLQVEKKMGKMPILFHLNNELYNNMFVSRLYWNDDSLSRYNGDINLSTYLFKDLNRNTAAQVSVHRSQFCINDSTWRIEPSVISYENSQLRVSDFQMHHSKQSVRINGVVAKNSDELIEANLRDVNLEYVFNLVNFHSVDFSGLVTGKITAGKLFSDKPALNGHVNVANFRYNNAYMGNLDLKAGFDLKEVSLSLDGTILDPSNAANVHVSGYVNPGTKNNGLDLNIEALNANMGFLNGYIDGVINEIEGRGTGHIRVFGPLKRINLEGSAVANVEGIVPALNTKYKISGLNIDLVPDKLTFHPTTLYDRYGNSATVSGTLLHDALHKLRYHFDVHSDNILGYDTQGDAHELFWGTIFARGDVHINGEPGEVTIDVKVNTNANSVLTYNATHPDDLSSGTYITFRDKNKKEEEDAVDVRSKMQSAMEAIGSNVYINFDVNVASNGTVKVLMDAKTGDYIALNGNGHLTASFYNKGAFNMYGLYEITDGIYKLCIRDVIHKDFKFRNGSRIVFNGNPMQANLDMKASYLVPAASLNDLNAGVTFSQNAVKVNCIMNLTGKVEQPIVNFDLELPNVSSDEEQMVRSLIATEEDRNMQVIYLLGIGRFYTYNANSTQSNQSTAAMNSILSNTLSGQINQTLSNVIGNRNWTFGTNLSTGSDGWNSMDIEGLVSGSFLNNRLLFNGNFGYREQNMTNNGNIIGDFDIQWFPFATDRISLKGYSETNDRYFTKSALTTQGVGIVWKYDFNNWSKLLPVKRSEKLKTDTLQVQ